MGTNVVVTLGEESVYVILHDELESLCVVPAGSPDEAREKISKDIKQDVSHLPVYDIAVDADIEKIIQHVASFEGGVPPSQAEMAHYIYEARAALIAKAYGRPD